MSLVAPATSAPAVAAPVALQSAPLSAVAQPPPQRGPSCPRQAVSGCLSPVDALQSVLDELQPSLMSIGVSGVNGCSERFLRVLESPACGLLRMLTDQFACNFSCLHGRHQPDVSAGTHASCVLPATPGAPHSLSLSVPACASPPPPSPRSQSLARCPAPSGADAPGSAGSTGFPTGSTGSAGPVLRAPSPPRSPLPWAGSAAAPRNECLSESHAEAVAKYFLWITKDATLGCPDGSVAGHFRWAARGAAGDFDQRFVKSFLAYVARTFFRCATYSAEAWGGMAADEAEREMGRYFYQRVYHVAFSNEKLRQADLALCRRLEAVRPLLLAAPEVIGVNPALCDDPCFAVAVSHIEAIDSYATPRDKFDCIYRCCLKINEIVGKANSIAGADDFVALTVIAIVKANISALHSNISYVEKYVLIDQEVEESGEAFCFFTHFRCAAEYLNRLLPEELVSDIRRSRDCAALQAKTTEELKRCLEVVSREAAQLHADAAARASDVAEEVDLLERAAGQAKARVDELCEQICAAARARCKKLQKEIDTFAHMRMLTLRQHYEDLQDVGEQAKVQAGQGRQLLERVRESGLDLAEVGGSISEIRKRTEAARAAIREPLASVHPKVCGSSEIDVASICQSVSLCGKILRPSAASFAQRLVCAPYMKHEYLKSLQPIRFFVPTASAVYVSGENGVDKVTCDGTALIASPVPTLTEGAGTITRISDEPTQQGLAYDHQTGELFYCSASKDSITVVSPDNTKRSGASAGTSAVICKMVDNVYGISVCPLTGNIAVTTDSTVQIIKPKEFVQIGSGEIGVADGPKELASFHSPRGICFDCVGTLIVADYGNNAVRKISPQGCVSTAVLTPTSNLCCPVDIGFADGKGSTLAVLEQGKVTKLTPEEPTS
eukprot:m51a1_g10058 putative rab5 gdp gtp exchange factor-like isoform x1 (896) ;mRNA; r:72731-76091